MTTKKCILAIVLVILEAVLLYATKYMQTPSDSTDFVLVQGVIILTAILLYFE